MTPPSMPDLPPMQPAQSAAPAQPQAAPSAVPKAQVLTSRRLRQLVGYVGGASLGFVLLVSAGELALRPELKPTTLLATIEAHTDLGIMNQKLGAKPGELLLTEADYRAKLAEAERNGQARAELAFQKELAAVQADKERVVGAYQTLYQRTGAIAQAGLQMEAQAQQFRQQLLAMSNGGRATVLAVEDGLCALGDESMCEKARALRKGMVEESTQLSEGDLAKKVNELMAGVEDPAAFITREDQRLNGTPALDR